MAGDERSRNRVSLPNPAGVDGAEGCGNLRQIGQSRKRAVFALRQPPAKPHHRDAQDWLGAIELADDAARSAAVERGGGPGVVFEEFDALVAPAVNDDVSGRLQGAQAQRAAVGVGRCDWSACECPAGTESDTILSSALGTGVDESSLAGCRN